MNRGIDLVGWTFGRLGVIASAGHGARGLMWRCVCVCGNEKEALGAYLRDGRVRSCGCLRLENIAVVHAINRDSYLKRGTPRRQEPARAAEAWPNSEDAARTLAACLGIAS